MATWPSGKAGVCNTLIAGSIPAVASLKIPNNLLKADCEIPQSAFVFKH